jgi:hypothetical protein
VGVKARSLDKLEGFFDVRGQGGAILMRRPFVLSLVERLAGAEINRLAMGKYLGADGKSGIYALSGALEPFDYLRLVNALKAVYDITLVAGHGKDAELSLDTVLLDDVGQSEDGLVGVVGNKGSAVGGEFVFTVEKRCAYGRRAVVDYKRNRSFFHF